MHAVVPNAQNTWPHFPTWWWLVILISPVNNGISSMDDRTSPSMALLAMLVSLWVSWFGSSIVKRWRSGCKLSFKLRRYLRLKNEAGNSIHYSLIQGNFLTRRIRWTVIQSCAAIFCKALTLVYGSYRARGCTGGHCSEIKGFACI